MNFVEMILPASSDNSLAKIYILFVKNSILWNMLVIWEDVIDEILLLMSISMPSQIIRWQRIQTDFVTFGTKSEFIKVLSTKLKPEIASWHWRAIPEQLSRKPTISKACKCLCFTKGCTTFVKTNGAEDKPKGRRTVTTKHFVAPLISQEKRRYVWWNWKCQYDDNCFFKSNFNR